MKYIYAVVLGLVTAAFAVHLKLSITQWEWWATFLIGFVSFSVGQLLEFMNRE